MKTTILFLLFVLSAGAYAATPDHTTQDERSNAIFGALVLRKTQREPDSFKLDSALVTDMSMVCYRYRGRNGFGGMSFGRAMLSADKSIFVTDSHHGFEKAWKIACAGQPGAELASIITRVAL